MLKQAKIAYEKVFKVLEENKKILNINISEIKLRADSTLLWLELTEKYGFNLSRESIIELNYNSLGEYCDLLRFKGDGSGFWILREDNNKKPEDELLLRISFIDGIFLFPNSTQNKSIELFKSLWEKLKSYNPKYIDSTHHELFFALENAGKIHNDFPELLIEFRTINKERFIQDEIEKYENKIKKLKEK